MKKFNRIIASILLLSFMLSTVWSKDIYASQEVLSASPYAYLETEYSDTVTCGTIRYISQIQNQYFYEDYWEDYVNKAYTNCAAACLSMALSYIGISKTPGQLLAANNGTLYWVGWGASYTDSRSDSSFTMEKAFENYVNGKGKYSPPILQFINKNHFMVLGGIKDDGTLLVVDPGTRRVRYEIATDDALYSDIGRVIQLYNKDAVLGVTHSHTWGSEYIIDKEATCYEEGSKSLHCKVCDAINTSSAVSIPVTEHSFDEWVVDKEATCTEEGYKSIHCSICGESDESTKKAIPATGHDYSEWTIVKDATYTSTGVKTRECKECDHEETGIIEVYKVEHLKLDAEYMEVLAGDTFTLNLNCAPIEAAENEVTWRCSNGSVASVDASGNVKAVAPGTAKIIATVAGHSVTCEVIVRQKNTSDTIEFTDVAAGSWYKDFVYYVAENGIMAGTGNTTFGPDGVLSRAQFAVILHRMNGAPDVAYEAVFPDVADYMWYTDAALWANSEGIIKGYNSGKFGTNDNITREQIALMMYRYAQYEGYNVEEKASLEKYSDAGKVSSYALEAMQWAVGNGIITGKGDGTILDPQGAATRAECATIIMRFVENPLNGNQGKDEITLADVCQIVAEYYNNLSETKDYVAYESECTKTYEGYTVPVRYTGGSQANVLVAMVEVDLETGEAADEWGNVWNIYE